MKKDQYCNHDCNQGRDCPVRAGTHKPAEAVLQIQEPEADIWPCVNIDVDERGNVTNAKLYSPGLPAGNHDVYPVSVPYIDEHSEAWLACAAELEKASPGFMTLGNMNGIECAVAAIRDLAARAASAQAAPAAVAVPGAAIAGALFDFCGYLTTLPRQQAITASEAHEASPMVEALEQWAAKRNLQLDDADVQGWRAAIAATTAAAPVLPEPDFLQRHEDVCGDEVGPPTAFYTADTVRALLATATGLPAHVCKDSTPQLHVGDSSFEGWYAGYVKEGTVSLKQNCRDAYAAGMGDPLVVAAPHQAALNRDARNQLAQLTTQLEAIGAGGVESLRKK